MLVINLDNFWKSSPRTAQRLQPDQDQPRPENEWTDEDQDRLKTGLN